ncbi:MAG: UDP-2,3-diacylglucosamine diphosphatase [Flavobacteriaceae bacterium]|nr:UDP-2,3-diacylglucosamine diphosphatase [Flavobacteriaceae bacterium]
MPKKNTKKRKVDLVVISDVHLGTYGCHAKELLNYLKSIQPKKVVLNGDIIDIWQFKKHYWPKAHMKVVRHLIGWITNGVEVHYITGNHDEMLRRFVNFKINSFTIQNKVVLELNGKKAWFFHGDVFDVTMQHSKWLTKLGAVGYDALILLNSGVNTIGKFLGKGKISLSKKIKDSVKSAVKYINNFEQTAADIAVENRFDYVVCGHIHQPTIKTYNSRNGKVTYLNSGDWIENLTALEYHKSKWSIYRYDETHFMAVKGVKVIEDDITEKSNKEIFNELLADFNIRRS